MLGMNSPTAGPRDAWSEFFGQVTSGVGKGMERLGAEVLPNWVASELELQEKDQLQRTLFDPEGRPAPVRIEGPATIGLAGTTPEGESFFQKTFLDLGTLQITGGGLLIMAGVLLGSVFVLKKIVMKR